ncbi:ATP-binding protein [Pelovirga terrestris]|nr:ATP-binding protein [Pelovirga terrestris]
MRRWLKGSIGKNLALLLIIALIPAFSILLFSGVEQRQIAIKGAEKNVQLLTRSMAQTQFDLVNTSRSILSTLALLPEIQNVDLAAGEKIFQSLIKQNPEFQNFTLTDLNGEVLAAALPFENINLADRKHFREAIADNDFAVGEYIIARVGIIEPALAFAYPVRTADGEVRGVLTAAVNLARFSALQDVPQLSEKSFIAVTDHQGIRLYYQPSRPATNPIGQPIAQEAWDKSRAARENGIFKSIGSDGIQRVVAFEPISLRPDTPAYAYVWAGISEQEILQSANAILTRNLLLLLAAMIATMILAWRIGRATLVKPITTLARFSRNLVPGTLLERPRIGLVPKEITTLSDTLFDMATRIEVNRKTLSDSESRFRLIMDSLDAMVYVADMQTYEILFINRHGRKIFGDITGQICWQALQSEQSGPCPFCTNHLLIDAQGKPTGIHTWEFHNTRNQRWYYIMDRAISWIDGRIVRLEIATDITDKKDSERALAAEKEQLAVTLDSIGDAVITTDTKGHVVRMNPIATELTGWNINEATGRPLAEVFHIINEQTGELCESPVEKVLSSGQIVGLANHTALISRDGQMRSIADSGAPITTNSGETIGVVLVFRDITDQYRLERELEKARKIESLGLLAGGIAHDFNNMLSAILGNIDLSLLDSNLAEKTRKRLEDATKASLRARDLTRQLLTFAKGGQPIRQTASLPEIIKDSAEFILHGAEVSCCYDFAAELPLVDIDTNQISQVIQNLILNAVQSMPKGGVLTLSCAVAAGDEIVDTPLDPTRPYVRVTISDQGEGIPADIIDKVFDPYFSTKPQGSGLGLSIVHSIISKHDGHIQVDSSPGQGTTFSMYLPASAKKRQEVNIQADKPVNNRLQGKVLVMDDEESVRHTICLMLEEFGLESLAATDGEEAVRLYREHLGQEPPIGLTILDLTVPGGKGGKEAAQEILALDADARIVVSSGYSQDPIMANYREHGFCAVLAKPFDLDELGNVLNIGSTAR